MRQGKYKESTEKSRLVGARLTDKLKYVDILGFLRKIGSERVSRADLRKILITTHEIYGSEYLIRVSKEYMAHPKKFDLKFPSKLGKINAIEYFAILNKFTKDEKYLEAIVDYKNDSDPEVSKFAKYVRKRISEKED